MIGPQLTPRQCLRLQLERGFFECCKLPGSARVASEILLALSWEDNWFTWLKCSDFYFPDGALETNYHLVLCGEKTNFKASPKFIELMHYWNPKKDGEEVSKLAKELGLSEPKEEISITRRDNGIWWDNKNDCSVALTIASIAALTTVPAGNPNRIESGIGHELNKIMDEASLSCQVLPEVDREEKRQRTLELTKILEEHERRIRALFSQD